MQVLELSQLKPLFNNEDDFNTFIKRLEDKIKTDWAMLLLNGTALAGLSPKTEATQRLKEELQQRWLRLQTSSTD